jgi:hypothetical protein
MITASILLLHGFKTSVRSSMMIGFEFLIFFFVTLARYFMFRFFFNFYPDMNIFLL